jgi:hypothetical protein
MFGLLESLNLLVIQDEFRFIYSPFLPQVM